MFNVNLECGLLPCVYFCNGDREILVYLPDRNQSLSGIVSVGLNPPPPLPLYLAHLTNNCVDFGGRDATVGSRRVCVWERETDRHRQSDTHTHTHTEAETNRQTERERDPDDTQTTKKSTFTIPTCSEASLLSSRWGQKSTLPIIGCETSFP